MNKWGIDGSYWGSDRYDVATSSALWPYPYQERIFSLMCSSDTGDALTTVSTNDPFRGLCRSGVTFSDYVVGFATSPKTCPTDICIGAAAGGGAQPEPVQPSATFTMHGKAQVEAEKYLISMAIDGRRHND